MFHRFLYVFIFITSFCAKTADSVENKKLVRGSYPVGLFAEFMWVLNHLEHCVRTDKIPVIYWDEQSSYYSPEGHNNSYNCWEYYFEPVSDLSYKKGDKLRRKWLYNQKFSAFWWYRQYIDNILLLSEEDQQSIKCIPLPSVWFESDDSFSVRLHLYDRRFRKYVKEELIDKFITIKPIIQEKIDTFYREYMEGKHVIGVHLRGKHVKNELGEVPAEMICDEANQRAQQDSIFYVATDQTPLLDLAKDLLNGEVVYQDCYRQEKPSAPDMPQEITPQMGEDVLIDACLLSRCDDFVHTLSCVSTCVLYFNPDLTHTLLYCGGEEMNKKKIGRKK